MKRVYWFIVGLIIVIGLIRSVLALGLTDDVYDRPRHFPALDCTAPNAVIVEPTDNLYGIINAPDKSIFCLRPGTYPSLTLATSGTETQARFLVPLTDQATLPAPWAQPSAERVTLSHLSITASHWIVAGLHITSDASSTVDLFFGATHNTLDTILVEGLAEANPAGYGGSLIKFNEGSTHNTLQYSVIRRPPRSPYTDFHCIVIRDSQFNHITHNEIYDCPGDGIQLLWLPQFDTSHSWDNRGTTISHNEIYLTPALYAECESGLLNPAGQCACAENGLDIKLTSTASDLPLAEQLNITHNTLYGFRQTAPACGGTGDISAPAILLHRQYTQQANLHNNLIFNVGTGVQLFNRGAGGPHQIALYNNIFSDITDTAIKIGSGRDHHITHNTISLSLDNNASRQSIHLLKDVQSATVTNNLIFSAHRRYQGHFDFASHNPTAFPINNNAYIKRAVPLQGISEPTQQRFENEPLANFQPHCLTTQIYTNPITTCLPHIIPSPASATQNLALPSSIWGDFFNHLRAPTPDHGAIEND